MPEHIVTNWDIGGAFLIGFIVAYGFTPFIREVAFKTGMLDHPAGKKSHAHPTPLLGGVAIFIAILTAVVFSMGLDRGMIGIFIGASMLLLTGLVDDKLGMMPQLKLCVQILAGFTAFKFGLAVTTIEDYYLSMFFTVFWIVGITNAFNLLDNLNGLSGGIAAISAFFFCAITFMNGDYQTAALSACIAGACAGFLPYNFFPRARIFMGDSGSLVLGFLLACIAIMGSWETDKISLSLSIPIAILGYPIFDTTLVTLIRLREGRSIFQGGKDHSSHILAFVGLKKKRAVLLIFGICLLLGVAALIIKYSPSGPGFTALASAFAAMTAFGARLFYLRSKMVKIKHAKKRKN